MLFLTSILAAIGLGLLYPFAALTLMPFGFLFFAALMFAAGFTPEPRRHDGRGSWQPAPLLAGLFLSSVFLPLLQLSLGRLLLSDSHYLAGVYFGALAPVAIVAPFFTRALGGDELLSHRLMVLSSALFPFLAPAMLLLVPAGRIPLDLLALAKGMLLLVVAPVGGALLANRLVPGLRARLAPALPLVNSACLALLVFILFGTAAGRLNLSYSSLREIGKLLALAFLQDFGVLALLLRLAPLFFPRRQAVALAVSLSMKNTAIAASLLLFFAPGSALPPSLVFVPHAFLFALLPWLGRRERLRAAAAR